MKKNSRKRKFNLGIGLIVVLIAFAGFLVFNTSDKTKIETSVSEKMADSTELSHCPGVSGVYNDEEGNVEAKYQIEADIKGETLKITIDPQGKGDILKKMKEVKFKLDSINGKAVASNYLLYDGHNLSIAMSSLSGYKSSDDDAHVLFTAKDAIITDPKGTDDCLTDVQFILTVDNAYGGKQGSAGSDSELESFNDISLSTSSVNCDNPTTAFEQNYCNIEGGISSKAKVTRLGDFSDEIKAGNGAFKGNNISLKCDVKAIHDKSTESSDYFSNVATMTATYTDDRDLGLSYRYRFAPGNYYYDTAPLKCSVTCTEKVKVEYGPPVAVKAGLCFEYQVKATSYVNCETTKTPSKPKQFKGYCDPTPRCVHKTYTITRAGPDDEFDDCIDACDGGEYTDLCSQKCYDKVYARTNRDMLNYEDYNYAKKIVSATIESQVNECLAIARGPTGFPNGPANYRFKLNNYEGTEKNGNYGCYYWTSTRHKKISWWGDDTGDKRDNTPTRYYYDKDPGRNYSIYVVVGGGFVRKKHGNNDYCHAKCHYSTTSCDQYFDTSDRSGMLTKNEYLNPGMAKADNIYNKSVYKTAVELCKAKQTCNETTATFTISAGGTVTDVEDNLSYRNGVLNNGEEYSKKLSNSAYLKEFGGCYKNASIKRLSYLARWGFRGACINTKYGTLSNTGANCGSGYKRYPNKYCVPLNEKNVNEKWWNYYYTQLYNSMNVDPEEEVISVDSAKFKDECVKDNNCNWKVNDIEEDYKFVENIQASTRAFGYFKWNIDVSCFYAINNNICRTPPTTTPPECINENYYIRSVDLRNMFPDTKGKATSADSTGRRPGFNWSKYATHAKKDENYTSFPSKYIEWIQKNEYNVYADSYLDYQVRLTREDIKDLKKATAATDFKYANYDANEYSGGSVINSVVNYKSKLLRETLENTIFPDDNSLKCNNMKNHNSGCETISN